MPSQINGADHVYVVAQNEGLFTIARTLQEKMSRLFPSPPPGFQYDILARHLDMHAEVVRWCPQIGNDHFSKVMHVDDHFANSEIAQTGKA